MRARIALPLASLLAGAASSAEPAHSQQQAPPARLVPAPAELQTPDARAGRDAGALMRPEAARFLERAQQGQGNRQTLCRGATVPTGWIIVDYDRDRSRCGGDNPAALNAFNVVVIERFDNRAVDSTMEICAATPAPSGWTLVDVFRDNRRCGRPTEPFEANVKRIRRAR